ncbi:cytochrome P450 3A30 [Lepidopterella palustris CBS 459.81]|uniref:Cytochrome P450 3A30 n=1 Tax=Lepidopterella palustris CBS 459.81 TaxID=1314670 RepID=A0A8E2EE28_9PEZI|nr:cytochrome P450 3A30 [Lepidopterella palustris CBS 459.81]
MTFLNQTPFKLVFSVFVAWFLYAAIRLVRYRRFYKDLPKPPHSFLWGHLKLFGEIVAMYPPNTHPQAYYTSLSQKYNLPGIFYIDLWPLGPSLLIIADPDTASQVTVLKSYPKHIENANFLSPMVGRNNIASVNGSTWKLLHNMLAPAFAPLHVKNLVGMMADEVTLFRGTLGRMSQTGEVFSMEETAGKLVFDIIGKAVFNFPLNAQTTGSECLRDFKEILKMVVLGRESWNPLTKARASFKRKAAIKRADSYIDDKIRERYDYLKRENIEVTKKNALSILDLVLRERLQESRQMAEKDSAAELDPDFMELAITNIKALLVGGHGTTTDTLCFIYMLLSIHPEAMQHLRQEHDRVFHSDISTTHSMLHDSPHKLNELDYTTAVIKETLRLFPVGFGIRTPDKSSTLTYKGRLFPIENQMISPCQHTMHYNPAIFPEPAKFDPERFLREGEVPRNAWRPFERGARACMGQDLAVDELRVILLLTVREFEFECAGIKPNEKQRCAWTDMDLRFGDIVFQELGLEAKPRGGMMMKVRRRV